MQTQRAALLHAPEIAEAAKSIDPFLLERLGPHPDHSALLTMEDMLRSFMQEPSQRALRINLPDSQRRKMFHRVAERFHVRHEAHCNTMTFRKEEDSSVPSMCLSDLQPYHGLLQRYLEADSAEGAPDGKKTKAPVRILQREAGSDDQSSASDPDSEPETTAGQEFPFSRPLHERQAAYEAHRKLLFGEPADGGAITSVFGADRNQATRSFSVGSAPQRRSTHVFRSMQMPRYEPRHVPREIVKRESEEEAQQREVSQRMRSRSRGMKPEPVQPRRNHAAPAAGNAASRLPPLLPTPNSSPRGTAESRSPLLPGGTPPSGSVPPTVSHSPPARPGVHQMAHEPFSRRPVPHLLPPPHAVPQGQFRQSSRSLRFRPRQNKF